MDRFSPDTVERLSGALGAAVLKVWGQLPHDFQHRIFEEAVVASGEGIRISLAQLLHAKHPRTTAAMSNQALVEVNTAKATVESKPVRVIFFPPAFYSYHRSVPVIVTQSTRMMTAPILWPRLSFSCQSGSSSSSSK